MKIALSKSQWRMIGKLTGWMKEAQIVDVDGRQYLQENGRWYDENLNEVPNPMPAEPKQVEFVIRGHRRILKEGERYKNSFGNYLLRSIRGHENPQTATVTVEYLDGQMRGETKTYPARAQVEAIYSELVRSMQETGGFEDISSGQSESYTIGILAKCKLVGAIRSDKIEEVKRIYQTLTGDDFTPFVEGREGTISIRQPELNYGNSFRAVFPKPLPVTVLNKMSIKGEQPPKDDWWNITYTKFFNLLRLGFKMGSHHDIGKIRGNVSDLASFDDGYGQDLG